MARLKWPVGFVSVVYRVTIGEYALVYGNPARVQGKVDKEGNISV
jgi:hypothetical protein